MGFQVLFQVLFGEKALPANVTAPLAVVQMDVENVVLEHFVGGVIGGALGAGKKGDF